MGIIPAAGTGTRWGGYFKELLPCGNDEWLLDRTIRIMKSSGASSICLITRPLKVCTHIHHINNKYDSIFYVMQKDESDIWGAMKASFPYTRDMNFFAMPDTYFPETAFNFNHLNKSKFILGLHRTKIPERFGVLIDSFVINKPKTLQKDSYLAWGTLMWTKEVVELWKSVSPKSYTHAINIAIKEFGCDSVYLDYYYDMATWSDYREFIRFRNGEW